MPTVTVFVLGVVSGILLVAVGIPASGQRPTNGVDSALKGVNAAPEDWRGFWYV